MLGKHSYWRQLPQNRPATVGRAGLQAASFGGHFLFWEVLSEDQDAYGIEDMK